ncbi:50S ribosomal protein L35 [Acidobacteriia bacterium AH_259_A11_L15]|nr:50S ribosomal protein L35 [Acidobacteriia bacterium AH_259_A11_L15]
MPKLKTHRGAMKRFKKTARGKFLRRRALMRHLLSGKRKKRKRQLRRTATVSAADAVRIRQLLPYRHKM